jgi:hypothetical protein
MNNIFDSKNPDDNGWFKLLDSDSSKNMYIRPAENGYQICESINIINIPYETIKQVIFTKIQTYTNGYCEKHYYKYSIDFMNHNNNIQNIVIKIPYNIIDIENDNTNINCKKIHNIVISDYELFLLKSKKNINDYIKYPR